VGLLRWLVTFVLLHICLSHSFAFELHQSLQRADLSPHLSLLEDPTGRLEISEVASDTYASRFKAWDSSHGSVNLGFTSSNLWVRLTMSRKPDSPERWLLEVPYAYNKFLDFYAPGQPTVLTGSGRPVSTRPLFDRFFLFPITVKPEPQTFYFRVASNYTVSLPLQIWEPRAYTKHAQQSNLVNALYYGGLLALAIYNLFLYFSLNDKRFLFYSLFALSLNAGIFAGNGLMQLFFWPDSSSFHEISSQFFFALAGFAGSRFCRLFLRTDQYSALLSNAMRFNEWAYVLLTILLFGSLVVGFSPYLLFIALAGLGSLSAVLIISGCVLAIRGGVSGIRFFVIAWGILVAGVVIAALRQINLLPTNTLTSYSLQIASGFEMLLLAFALAEIVQSERRARLKAQAQALSANEKLIEVLREAEQRLDGAVQDRTKRLQESVLRERHLLGQYLRFGAMISHEFRNPLGIIDSQATIIQKAKELNEDLRHRVTIIRKTVLRLAELFDVWLAGDQIRLAIDRLELREISLRSWAENMLDKIPHCTATHPIQLEINPDADRIWVDGKLLEIAVINLIENACKYSPAGSLIVLKGLADRGQRGICVIDCGPGISSEHLARLGEDYYRADPNKPKGMGLGLSVVKEIAQVLGGRLQIESEVGVGSRFSLVLPDKEQVNG
jgi:signal transduction histidine kinase